MKHPLLSLAMLFTSLALGCTQSPRTVFNPSGDLAVPPDGALGDLSFLLSTDQAGPACATGNYEGKQSPAALLVLLDRSQSMGAGNKYDFSAQAIVQALDGDTFDSMSIGLLAAPSMQIAGPDCILGTPVSCGVPPFPQVALALAGNQKSGAGMGVRSVIKSQLQALGVDGGPGNANPMYLALQSGIAALQAWPGNGKRILFMITDGTVDCCEGAGRPGCYVDGNGCHDWENPNNLIKLLAQANKDPKTPIETFIMGVPGADTFDQTGVNFPPYHMRAALSAIAYAGSPDYVPANCTGKTFTQNSPDPQVSCHFDFTQNLKVASIAQAIANIRGKVLGCLFDLPEPDGGVVDPTQVNVNYTIHGVKTDLKKRNDPMNQCLQIPCWDYANGKVQLVGKACSDVQTTADPKVQILVGCPTVIG